MSESGGRRYLLTRLAGQARVVLGLPVAHIVLTHSISHMRQPRHHDRKAKL